MMSQDQERQIRKLLEADPSEFERINGMYCFKDNRQMLLYEKEFQLLLIANDEYRGIICLRENCNCRSCDQISEELRLIARNFVGRFPVD
jgi:hypothetical protein